jgi:hypothetical protein
LFLRDVVTLVRVERNFARDPEKYPWCQPIDVWVRTVAKELRNSKLIGPAPRSGRRFRLSRSDRKPAWGVVQLSFDAGVSPLKVNQGIWYFASNAVAETDRLRKLIHTGSPKRLDAELALIRGFLPARLGWK